MLKTDYQNDQLAQSNSRRHYAVKKTSDNSVVHDDVYLDELTQYSQVGDSFGAVDINATNTAINDLTTDVKRIVVVSSLPSTGVNGTLYLCTT